MTLSELIALLEGMPPDTVIGFGLTNPHSYRGYYDELAFEPTGYPQTAGAMLAIARSALGAVYEGWKGGEFTMSGHTTVWLAEEGCIGEHLTEETFELARLRLQIAGLADPAHKRIAELEAALAEACELADRPARGVHYRGHEEVPMTPTDSKHGLVIWIVKCSAGGSVVDVCWRATEAEARRVAEALRAAHKPANVFKTRNYFVMPVTEAIDNNHDFDGERR